MEVSLSAFHWTFEQTDTLLGTCKGNPCFNLQEHQYLSEYVSVRQKGTYPGIWAKQEGLHHA